MSTLSETDSPSVRLSKASETHYRRFSDSSQIFSESEKRPLTFRRYFGATCNLINLIIGTGIIGLPQAVSQCGFTVGVILLCLVAWMADFSSRLLVKLALDADCDGYEHVARKAWGLIGFYIMALSAFISEFGSIVAYTVVIGDTFPAVIKHYYPGSFFANRDVLTLLIGLLIVYPLLLIRSMKHLEYSSALSTAVVVVLVLTVIIRGQHYAVSERLEATSSSTLSLFAGIGTMSFAYEMHDGIHAIAHTLRPHLSCNTWDRVSAAGFGLSFVFSTTFGIAGYLIFRDDVKGNILNNFPFGDVVINISRLAFGFTMIPTIVSSQFVEKDYIYAMIFPKNTKRKMTLKWQFMIQTASYLPALALGIFVRDLGIVLSLTGTFAAAAIMFTCPTLFALQIYGWEYYKTRLISFACVVFIFLFGLVSFFIGSVVIILMQT